MKLKTYLLIGLILLFSREIQASSSNSNYIITEKKLRNHVEFLTSDYLEGRMTGSLGEKLATQYIAKLFQNLGLEPAGDNGTFFQEFNFTKGISLGKNNTLFITTPQGTKPLKLNQDWRPLSFSDSVSFENSNLIFAGFGITAPALDKLPTYDSYKNKNVKNKWVIVLKALPEKISAEQRKQLNPYSSLRYKAFIAKKQGAQGIIFINNPDSKIKSNLIPSSLDKSLLNSGIIAICVKDEIIDALLNQPVTIKGQIDIERNILRGRNVLAKLTINSDAKQMIIIGAHVDHLGRGELNESRAGANETGAIHSGADDNASGVASILEIAAYLHKLKTDGKLTGNKNILFAAWSGEEFGILGSSHFAKNFAERTENKSLRPSIDANLNLDMVGHLRKNLVLQGFGSSSDWPKLIKDINSAIPLITQNDPYLPTDSTSFYLRGVPILNIFTGAHENYHTPRDKAETLNYAGIKTISQFLIDIVLALESRQNSINYQEIPKTSDKPKREFRIYLGTIPDYATSDVSGVKLSGVAKNSPAEQAGIKPDDVVIELAGKHIHDIYDYTYALNELPIGKSVKMIVMRANTRMPLNIIARYRD